MVVCNGKHCFASLNSQNDFGMGWYGEKTMIENGSWGPKFDGSTLRYGNVYDNSTKTEILCTIRDNIRISFDTGLRYSNDIFSFNGATETVRIFVSLSQIKRMDIFPQF